MEVVNKPTLFRLGLCEVCATQNAKYKCPQCEVKTCSLPCVQIHKKELNCDGVRDKVKFKPLQQFANLDLQNDYKLLEEMSRKIEVLRENPLKRNTQRRMLPVHLYRLKGAAADRDVSLQFLPQHFTRHKENSTYLDWQTRELFWRIEWVFPQAENFTITDSKVLDTVRLATVMGKHLQAENSSKQLLFYQSTGQAGIILLLKAERIPGGKSFYQLDHSLSVQENLEGKVIVEFPVIYVILKDHKCMYDIIDADEEDEIAKTNKQRRERRRSNKRRIEKTDNNNTSESTNLLFSTNEQIVKKPEDTIFPTISYEFDY